MASPPDFTGTSTTTPVKSLSSFSHPIVLILLYALYHHTYVSSVSVSVSVSQMLLAFCSEKKSSLTTQETKSEFPTKKEKSN